jgi:glycosyltransferase involved in cell wall biosynthesis
MLEWNKAEESVNSRFISVIVPALNSADTIYYTLSSIFSSDFPRNLYEVIVVDNGSSDATVEVAKKFPAKILICGRKGQAHARNMGLDEASGDVICFTDSDVIVPKDWLKKISHFFYKFPEIDGVGGPIFPPSSGYKTPVQKWVGEIYFEDQNFPKKISTPQLYSYVGTPYSANSAFRKDALISVNFYDTSLWDGNDIDLAWRLIKKGRKLVFNPEIPVIHLGFPWTVVDALKKHFVWGRINVKLIRKHFENYSTEIVKSIIFSCYWLLKDFAGLFSFSNNPRQKQILKICIHLAFHFGRVFEVAHPFNNLPNEKI